MDKKVDKKGTGLIKVDKEVDKKRRGLIKGEMVGCYVETRPGDPIFRYKEDKSEVLSLRGYAILPIEQLLKVKFLGRRRRAFMKRTLKKLILLGTKETEEFLKDPGDIKSCIFFVN